MSKLTIPTVGTLLTLKVKWTFALYPERRNKGVWEVLVGKMPDWYEQYLRCRIKAYVPATLPKGTVLSVDRIYIRQNMPDFDSVSFRIKECPGPDQKSLLKKRFWAKLADVNNIDATWDEATVPRRNGPPVLPENVVVPPSELYYLKDRIPQEIRTAVITQYRIDKSEREHEYIVRLHRNVIHIVEVVAGAEVEIYVEPSAAA